MADGYLGNSNLKRIGEEIEWSPDLLQEYMKCAKDPIYFAKNYIKIVHVDKGLVPFKMYDYQENITRKITDNRRLAVLTARQSGKTTTAMAIILHYVLFNEFKTVAILANKGDAAREVMARVKLAFEALPKWLQQGVEEWNKGNIALENGCQVLAGTTSSSAIRGKSVNFLYLDEVAFIEGYDDFFASVYPTISSGESTKLLMTSTPNGLNHFWKTCTGAKEGTNGYEYEEVMWHDVPGRDEKWRKETIEALDHDEEKFNQEYCCQFLGSSGTLIAGWKLKELLHQTPIAQHDGFMQYEKPIKERQYSMTVDVARGKGLDYSCFSVIDITEMPYKQVAMFRDNMVGPIDFASVVYRIGQMYNTAAVLIEVNDIGEQVADVLLMDYGYDNILYTANNGRSGKMLTGGFGKKVDNGIRTTKNVKATGCSMLKMLVEQNQLIIQDYDTIQEISRFSKKANSFEAESGFHDDLVMNLVLFAWMTEQAYFKDMTDINTLIKLREKTEEQIEEELLPFGLIDSGEDFYYEDDGLRL
jgi:phage FluMu gp28-like protein